ncbi:MAG: C10 family peptidase [Candidatus Marinimicrobia bacterium]|nr:C10 family peptidase [Candidatus Neomarinimicrobiota bacterium]
MFIYSFDDGGFTIIPGNDAVVPILAYSTDSTDVSDTTNAAFNDWIQGYATAVDSANYYQTSNTSTLDMWDDIEDETFNMYSRTRSVAPLLSTTWGYGLYYNAECPEATGGPDGHAKVGCVAVAMGQIMNYYNHPDHGFGVSSYTHPVYGLLSVNHANTDFEWSNMPDGSLEDHNSDVATLLYHCGVAVHMDYGPDESNAWSFMYSNAIRDHFYYNEDRQYYDREDHTDSEWHDLLQAELDASRPIYYSGGGHAWVCDGYDSENSTYHMNWGINGIWDGDFFIGDLMPGGNDLNSDEEIYIHAFPALTVDLANLKGYNNYQAYGEIAWDDLDALPEGYTTEDSPTEINLLPGNSYMFRAEPGPLDTYYYFYGWNEDPTTYRLEWSVDNVTIDFSYYEDGITAHFELKSTYEFVAPSFVDIELHDPWYIYWDSTEEEYIQPDEFEYFSVLNSSNNEWACFRNQNDSFDEDIPIYSVRVPQLAYNSNEEIYYAFDQWKAYNSVHTDITSTLIFPNPQAPETDVVFIYFPAAPINSVDQIEALYDPCGDGDVNNDSDLDVLDLVTIVNHVLDVTALTGDALDAADSNCDDIIDVLDIVSFVNILVGNPAPSYPNEALMITSTIQDVNQDSTYMDIWLATETIVDGIQLELDVNDFGYNAIGVESTYYINDMGFASSISTDSTDVKIVIYNTSNDSLGADSHGTIARIWLTEDGTTSTPDSTDFDKQIFANLDDGGSYVDHQFGTLAEYKSFICDIDSTFCWGCTDDEALNYSPVVTYDDTSCVYLLGDMNADESLDVSDITILVAIIGETITPTKYQEFAGDMNSDHVIDVLDAVILANIIQSQRSLDRDLAEGEILISKVVNGTGIYEGEDASMTINLFNEPDVDIMLVRVDTEENYRITSVTLGERALEMDLQQKVYDDSTKLICLLYSIDGYEIAGGVGSILEVGLESLNLNLGNDPDSGDFLEVQLANSTEELLDYEVISSDEMGRLLDSGFTINEIPERFALNPAYPNPFNPITTISYELPVETDVSLIVYDLMGREVTVLEDCRLSIGYHSVAWDATGHSSGIYFVKLVTPEYTETQKVMLLK